MKVIAFAGGVGGAKLANGLAQLLKPEEFSIIVNTGDDFVYSGLYISPDLDTVTYTLAGINDPKNGWGIAGDSYFVLDSLYKIGHPVWFTLGDRDIATHIERTRLISSGLSLSKATQILSKRLGVEHQIIPMTDQPVRTLVNTEENGTLAFQEYFVRHQFKPVIKQIIFSGIDEAYLTESGRKNLQEADLVVFCPSNPFVSIDPILAIPGVREMLHHKTVIAVSPLIGGKTIKGPAAKMMNELGFQPNSVTIASHYKDLIQGILIDSRDAEEEEAIRQCGIISLVTNILIPDVIAQKRLAQEVLKFGENLLLRNR